MNAEKDLRDQLRDSWEKWWQLKALDKFETDGRRLAFLEQLTRPFKVLVSSEAIDVNPQWICCVLWLTVEEVDDVTTTCASLHISSPGHTLSAWVSHYCMQWLIMNWFKCNWKSPGDGNCHLLVSVNIKNGHSTQTRLVIALNANKPLSVCIQNTMSQRNTPRCVRTLTLCRVTKYQTTIFCWPKTEDG